MELPLEGSTKPVETITAVAGTARAGTPLKSAKERSQAAWRGIHAIRVAHYATRAPEIEDEFSLRSHFESCRDIRDVLRVLDTQRY